MTGPEHYLEAGLLLETICEYGCPHSGCEHERGHLARAQVHATLALAAATGLNDKDTGMSSADWAAWHNIASVKPDKAGGA